MICDQRLGMRIVFCVLCRLITDSIQDMAKSSGLTTNFLSIVLLPLAGNAVEHITAVMVAMKNKMDLSLGIAIGSSIQIALFVLPTCVLFSWAIGNNFTLQLDGLGAMLMLLNCGHCWFKKMRFLSNLCVACLMDVRAIQAADSSSYASSLLLLEKRQNRTWHPTLMRKKPCRGRCIGGRNHPCQLHHSGWALTLPDGRATDLYLPVDQLSFPLHSRLICR